MLEETYNRLVKHYDTLTAILDGKYMNEFLAIIHPVYPNFQTIRILFNDDSGYLVESVQNMGDIAIFLDYKHAILELTLLFEDFTKFQRIVYRRLHKEREKFWSDFEESKNLGDWGEIKGGPEGRDK